MAFFTGARRETHQGGSRSARRGYLLVDRYSMEIEGSREVIGDLERGYMVSPISRQVRSAAKIKTVKIDGKTLSVRLQAQPSSQRLAYAIAFDCPGQWLLCGC